jgi:hypothetical protein
MPNVKPGTWNQVNARPLTQRLFRTTFAKAIAANGVDPTLFTQIGPLGSGIGYSQTGGNLVLTSGTTANSEVILRSNESFDGNLELRWQTILSQRIINQSFVVELVDVIGDNLQLTANSATSATVTFGPGQNPFTATNVGQFMSIGAIEGLAGIPARYAIASVSGDTVTFTVSGWPTSGSGSCSLFGLNFVRCVYSGATATAMNFDTQRNGYNSGDTTATISTTASPGHMGIAQVSSGYAALLDQLVASAATLPTTIRASRVVNLPDEEADLFLQIRIVNGSTAPASTTTWTVGMAAVYDFRTANVTINDIRPQGPSAVIPTTIASGTVTTVSTVTALTTVTTSGTPTAPATPYILNSLATTNIALILTGTSGLHAFYATNTGATPAFVKLYNKATAPVLASDVPAMIIPIAAAAAGFPGVATLPIGHQGFRFALGLGIAITGAVGDTDTTAVAAGQVKVILSRTV